jgi:hypothetical protein
MIKEPSWRAKAMYIVFACALVFGMSAAVLTAQQAEGQVVQEPVYLDPSIAMNVKTADETFTVRYTGNDTAVDDSLVSNWLVTAGEGTGGVTVVAGGNLPGGPYNYITVRKVVIGDCIITADVMTRQGIVEVDAEKKWGEIIRTFITADQRTGIDPDDTVDVTEQVWAEFLPPDEDTGQLAQAVAAGAKITWWLLENADDDVAQTALETLIQRFGPNHYDFETGPTGWGEGCGQYKQYGYPEPTGDPTFIPEDILNAIYANHSAKNTEFTAADGMSIAPTKNYLTYTDIDGETEMEVTFNEVGTSGMAEPVIVVVLADYPRDKNGENNVCVEYIKFTPSEPTEITQVKTPQLRWAGEKIVLEKDWGERSSMTYDFGDEGNVTIDLEMYVAVYSQEGETIGNLEPIEEALGWYFDSGRPNTESYILSWLDLGLSTGANQVITTLGDATFAYVDPLPNLNNTVLTEYSESVSRCILVSEQQGQVDVNAALYMVNLIVDVVNYSVESVVIHSSGPIENYGFLVYYMAFEDIVLADTDMGALLDVTPLDGFSSVDPYEDVPVAVQVRGYFTSDALPGTTREAVDIDEDGIYDLPEGRYVMPNDWWALANYNYELRPNWDLMDQAHEDSIVSPYNAAAVWDGEEGPYDGPGDGVWTTVPTPGEAERPSIGPFSTLQRWSTALMWEAVATVPTSAMYLGRNTVVPDKVASWHDAPMPQALVIWDVVTIGTTTGFTTLDKGSLEGYGYDTAKAEYQSPFYQMEIPSHSAIPADGYDWSSWAMSGPYDMWTDLQKKSWGDSEPTVPNDNDLEVYCDNHGIAGAALYAPEQFGTVVIEATAEYPDALLKGKYGPITSDEITISWGAIELNPHFVADDTEVAVEELVTFENLTDGGTWPYTKAEWDFDADGSIDKTIVGTHAEVMAPATWAYDAPGIYTVRLWMTDSTPTTRYEERPLYIAVGGGGVQTHPWQFYAAGFWGQQLPNSYNGEVILDDLDTASIPDCVQGVWYFDPGILDYVFWIPAAGGDLVSLTGQFNQYYVLVKDPGVCTWEIPLQ